MSVISYCNEEIVCAIAACWDRGSIGSLDGRCYLESFAELANAIAAANRAAAVETYGDEGGVEPAITGADIKRALIGFTVERKLRGMRVLDGIRYNLIANNGKDFATLEILDGLLSLTRAALRLRDLRAAYAIAPRAGKPAPRAILQ